MQPGDIFPLPPPARARALGGAFSWSRLLCPGHFVKCRPFGGYPRDQAVHSQCSLPSWFSQACRGVPYLSGHLGSLKPPGHQPHFGSVAHSVLVCLAWVSPLQPLCPPGPPRPLSVAWLLGAVADPTSGGGCSFVTEVPVSKKSQLYVSCGGVSMRLNMAIHAQWIALSVIVSSGRLSWLRC